MSDNKVALVLFDIGFVMMLISMVTGPFEIVNWALTTAVVSCILAVASIYLAFDNLDQGSGNNYQSNGHESSKHISNR